MQNLKIGTRLTLAFGIVIALLMVFGYSLNQQMKEHLQIAHTAENHPRQVGHASQQLYVDLMGLRGSMRGVLLAQNDVERLAAITEVQALERDARQALDFIEAWALVDSPRVKEVRELLAEAQIVHQQIIQQVQRGETDQPLKVMGEHSGARFAELTTLVEEMVSIAKAKVAEFDQQARVNGQQQQQRMQLLLLLVVVSAAIVGILFARGIIGPLAKLSTVAEGIAGGDFARRCRLDRADEVGTLATQIDLMAAEIEQKIGSLEKSSAELVEQQQVQDGGIEITTALATAATLTEVVDAALLKILEVVESQVGAFYLSHDDSQDKLSLVASRGVSTQHALAPELDFGEEGAGLAAARRKTLVLRDIPDDCRFVVPSIAGGMLPKCLVHLPLLERDRVIGVLVIASLYDLSDEQLEMLDMIAMPLAIALSNARINQKTELLAKDLQTKNLELQAQSQEMQAQAEELKRSALELEAQRTEVERASRLKSEFLSNMSHELRTPLNAVLSLSQLMLSRGVGQQPQEETKFLEVIERNGQQLLGLINDILDLSKIESGNVSMVAVRFEPVPFLESIVETVQPLAKKKGLQLILDSSAELPWLHTDEGRLKQILLNLLSNAVKFTAHGEITLQASAVDGQIIFQVCDTGIGIADENLPDLFNEFKQVDGSSTRQYEGTGLGLAISQKLAHMLGGEISVTSELGQGSCFSLQIPQQLPNNSNDWDGLPQPVYHPPQKKQRHAEDAVPRLLLVEDNEAVRLQVSALVEELGFDIEVARDGEEGLAKIKTALPDAIILDLMMPKVDGFEVLMQLRCEPATENLPVLILTAKDLTTEDLQLLHNNRARQLVQKGAINKKQLAQELEALVADYRSPQAIDAAQPEAEALPETEAQLPLPGVAQPTILIVEDNPDNLLAVQSILAELDCRLLAADNGRRGVEMAGQHRPELILMDMQLPEINGMEATGLIKADARLAEIPVIALTARAMSGDRAEIIAAGCDDYLSKPINPAALLETVRKWLTVSQGDNK